MKKSVLLIVTIILAPPMPHVHTIDRALLDSHNISCVCPHDTIEKHKQCYTITAAQLQELLAAVAAFPEVQCCIHFDPETQAAYISKEFPCDNLPDDFVIQWYIEPREWRWTEE